MDVALFVKAFGGLFAIMNPFVALPMFLSLTAGYDEKRQRRTAVHVVLGSLLMLGVILASGSAVLGFFGISVNDFRIAGGLVLLMIALGMLNGTNTAHAGTSGEQEQQAQQARQGGVAFYPLTFPMLVGPGTITTIIVLTGQGSGTEGYLSIGAAVVAVLAILLVVLWFAAVIGQHMGQTLRTIMTRLMGMILAGIAVSMIIDGLAVLLPGLSR